MIPLNCPPTTLAHKMTPEAWRNIADCSTARHRLLRDSGCEDWPLLSREDESWQTASNLASLTREPFPITVGDGIRHHGKVPMWDGLTIDRDWHIRESVNTEPMGLPDYLDTAICDEQKDWQDLVCHYLQTVDDSNREYTWHDVDLTGENDLSGGIFAVAFCPADSPDWLWAGDSFLCIGGGLYDLSDSTIADCGILETSIGWHVATLADGEYIDGFDNLAAGYSSNPTGELRRMLLGDSEPVWHHALGCFVGRLAGHPEPVRLHPTAPCYC